MSYTFFNPYAPKAHSYKGQLHCHSTNSADGTQSPTVLITAYKTASYDFCSITDHGYLTADPGVAGILFVPGFEGGNTVQHIQAINPSGLTTSNLPSQTVINDILSAGGLPWLNHPHWAAQPWTAHEVKDLTGYYGIEVFSGVLSTGTANAEDVWDDLLRWGMLIFGTAVDDCHDVTSSSFNKGWVHVFADTLNLTDIINALENGNFYASTGPTMTISLSGSLISVITPDNSTIEWITCNGVSQSITGAVSDDYQIVITDQYVRVRITRDYDGKLAWSNPIWIREFIQSPYQESGKIDVSPIDRTNPLKRFECVIDL
jgi:hypothetical protein